MSVFRSLVAASALVLMGIAPASAATIVHVTLTGEGGEQMGIDLDAATVKAGQVVFEVKNAAMTEGHEFLVTKVKSKDHVLPIIQGKDRVDEKKFKPLGEVSDLKPGAGGKLEVNLKPGDYLLYCNLKGHYHAGMSARFTVTP